ncbi:50S ribosomal protein L11 methyltransferase [Nisaea acidiphila]|uniref:50S ribosomal protein L11 methyltransferase n=1 Tax=Nisaea acidiphila TaxID=1862145 RepID=A0A9J7AUI5_9PROT|nr:50S ribosomal protein L11 methyltransferase [Nisaea acidiphila]UUX49061.1 50S ribosomal protein L11 methyltransferase [Nisaea acidiphila]
MAGDYHRRVLGRVRELLDNEEESEIARLERALRLIAMHRSQLVSNTLRRHEGDVVRSGPFAGTVLPGEIAEGCTAPKLLGTYEAELHPVIEHVVARGYGTVVNIGSAEGYYAVGLARLMPAARILAYDLDPNARRLTAELAALNDVSERIAIGEAFAHEDFATLPAGDSFIFCDIEGAELELLDPKKAPALAELDLLVELHNLPEIPLYREFLERFEKSHEIEMIAPAPRNAGAFAELRALNSLDQLLAVWEWRRGPTPWVLLTAKKVGG